MPSSSLTTTSAAVSSSLLHIPPTLHLGYFSAMSILRRDTRALSRHDWMFFFTESARASPSPMAILHSTGSTTAKWNSTEGSGIEKRTNSKRLNTDLSGRISP